MVKEKAKEKEVTVEEIKEYRRKQILFYEDQLPFMRLKTEFDELKARQKKAEYEELDARTKYIQLYTSLTKQDEENDKPLTEKNEQG